jgi:hypothetical protein
VPRLTVCITHYKRHANVLRLLDCLSRQTIRPEIFLWNNSGKIFTDPRVTWQLDSSSNRFCWPRWFMLSLARTEFVTTIDDDLIFSDDRVLDDAVDALVGGGDPHRIVGFAGCIIHPDIEQTYKDGFHLSSIKFPWWYARELKWQDGIIYDASQYESLLKGNAATEAGAARNSGHEGGQGGGESKGDGVEARPGETAVRPLVPLVGARTMGRQKEFMKKQWLHTPRWVHESGKDKDSGTQRKQERKRNGERKGEEKGESKEGVSGAEDSNGQADVAENTGAATALAVDIVKGRMMMMRTAAITEVSNQFCGAVC